MHKLAVLQAGIEYVRYLERCVSELRERADAAAAAAAAATAAASIRDEEHSDEGEAGEQDDVSHVTGSSERESWRRTAVEDDGSASVVSGAGAGGNSPSPLSSLASERSHFPLLSPGAGGEEYPRLQQSFQQHQQQTYYTYGSAHHHLHQQQHHHHHHHHQQPASSSPRRKSAPSPHGNNVDSEEWQRLRPSLSEAKKEPHSQLPSSQPLERRESLPSISPLLEATAGATLLLLADEEVGRRRASAVAAAVASATSAGVGAAGRRSWDVAFASERAELVARGRGLRVGDLLSS